MEPRVGRVENGAIVLDDPSDLIEGASVTVWIGDPRRPVRASREELELVARGQAAAARDLRGASRQPATRR